MTAVTENDLKRLEDLIINGQKAIESRLTALELGQSDIRGDIKALDAKISGLNDRIKPIDKIPDLAEKVGEFKIWRQIVIIALTALATWIARSQIGNP